MPKIIHSGNLDWKGEDHLLELYKSSTLPTDHPISQCQAVPFLQDGRMVFYKHIDGYFGLPGGQVEGEEDFDLTLEREIMEECSCKVLASKFIGFLKDTNVATKAITYQLRYAAIVEPLDIPIEDPAGKALERHFFGVEEAIEKLNWGERGEKLINLAKEERGALVTQLAE